MTIDPEEIKQRKFKAISHDGVEWYEVDEWELKSMVAEIEQLRNALQEVRDECRSNLMPDMYGGNVQLYQEAKLNRIARLCCVLEAQL